MLNLIEEYKEIIYYFNLVKYRQEKGIYTFQAKLTFFDRSTLIIREYRFLNKTRKYAFHWMNSKNKLIIRWDNATHWRKLKTYPNHKHITKQDNIHISYEITLEQVLIYIKNHIKHSK